MGDSVRVQRHAVFPQGDFDPGLLQLAGKISELSAFGLSNPLPTSLGSAAAPNRGACGSIALGVGTIGCFIRAVRREDYIIIVVVTISILRTTISSNNICVCSNRGWALHSVGKNIGWHVVVVWVWVWVYL